MVYNSFYCETRLLKSFKAEINDNKSINLYADALALRKGSRPCKKGVTNVCIQN